MTMNKTIPISSPTLTEVEESYLLDAFRSGFSSSLGEYIGRFEADFASFCGTNYAVAPSNGTTALHLALAAFDVKSGDEVIVPDLTFIATANSVVYTGAKPVFADIDPETLCMDPDSFESLITERTKAVMPVHMYGHPCNMGRINAIAKKHGIIVIEDAAEAHGAEFEGKKVGSLGDCGAFSFFGNKIVTTGEGGIVTTNDQALYERLKFLRDHAMSKDKRYWHTAVGFNYRMTNLQAALGTAQLTRNDQIIEKKRAIFDRYEKAFSGVKTIKLNRTAPWAKNVYWMVCMECELFDEKTRERFMANLKAAGVDSRPYFYPVSDMPAYNRANTPNVHAIYKTGINLPSFFDLDLADVDMIAEKVLVELGKL